MRQLMESECELLIREHYRFNAQASDFDPYVREHPCSQETNTEYLGVKASNFRWVSTHNANCVCVHKSGKLLTTEGRR